MNVVLVRLSVLPQLNATAEFGEKVRLPATVKLPAAPKVKLPPSLKVKWFTVAVPFNTSGLIALPLTSMFSEEEGTPDGVQLLAVFQSEDTEPSQYFTGVLPVNTAPFRLKLVLVRAAPDFAIVGETKVVV